MVETHEDALSVKALHVATKNIGYGEDEGNNLGRFIRAIGGKPGAEWCATFVGYCFARAWGLLGFPGQGVPFDRSSSAKRLTKNIGRAGRLFTDPREALPGDVICWSRGVLGWQGHIGIVERVDPDGIVHTIEGNVGRYPAKVKRLAHDITKERFWRFASLRKEAP